MKRSLLAAAGIAVAALSVLFHVGCPARKPAGKPVVAVANSVLADFLSQVAGAHADVRLLAKPGDDPLALKPSDEHVNAVKASSAVFINGFGLEPWLEPLLKQAGNSPKVYVAARGVTPLRNDAGDIDPHAWMDPALAILYLEAARDMLIDLDPDHELQYREGADGAAERLRSLEAWMRTELDGLAPERRAMFLSSDTLRYFGARYGFSTMAYTAPGAAPTDEDKQRAIDFLGKKKLKVVFYEHGRNWDDLRELGMRLGRVPQGPLYTVTLGPPGTPEGTYDGAMRSNTGKIVKVLR